jgi:serine/threonine protein kinase
MAQMDVGSEFAGHRLEAIIGRGGMGVVYRARDLDLDRVVALKVIAPEFATDRDFRERFKRESQLAASIRHPNVISIYRAGEFDEQLFITMDYVEGTDLKAIIAVRGRLDPKLASSLVSQVAGGLDAAHARGLVHRDVKPANVRVLENRMVKIMDFGIAKALDTPSVVTGTGITVGFHRLFTHRSFETNPVVRFVLAALGSMAMQGDLIRWVAISLPQR